MRYALQREEDDAAAIEVEPERAAAGTAAVGAFCALPWRAKAPADRDAAPRCLGSSALLQRSLRSRRAPSGPSTRQKC
jgi:hypothetical protein